MERVPKMHKAASARENQVSGGSLLGAGADIWSVEHRELSEQDIERLAHSEDGMENVKDALFNTYMTQQLFGNFDEELADFDFSLEERQSIKKAMSEDLDEDSFVSVLALPYEVRMNWLQRLSDSRAKGVGAVIAEIKKMGELSHAHGYRFGFHTSPNDIRPGPGNVWVIRGTERDHRDDDLTMAYYSNKYRHLFKKKGPQFIYVVRSQRSDRSDGNWSRAPSLSVITRFPFAQVHGYVEREARRIEERKRKETVRSDGAAQVS